MTQRSYAFFLFVAATVLLFMPFLFLAAQSAVSPEGLLTDDEIFDSLDRGQSPSFPLSGENDQIRDAQRQFIGDLGQPGIVPCGDDVNFNGVIDPSEQCGLCHLVALGAESLRFAVFFTVFVATLMFVYAGFLYITAGGDTSKISAATGIFGKVVVGMIIVLTAWLIVDTALRSFLSEKFLDFQPWNAIDCKAPQDVAQGIRDRQSSGQSGGPSTLVPATRSDIDPPATFDPTILGFPPNYLIDGRTVEQKGSDELALRNELTGLCESSDNCTISINKGNCPPNVGYMEVAGGCTDLTGLQRETRDLIVATAYECGQSSSNQCLLRITGGSELGNAVGALGCAENATSHCSGNKLDVSKQVAVVNNYVLNEQYFSKGVCPDGRNGRVNKLNNSCWVDEGDHWDVTRGGL